VELLVGISLRVLGGLGFRDQGFRDLGFSWIHGWQDPDFLQLATGIPRDQQNSCWSSRGPDLNNCQAASHSL
jgi:hypothetical protein